MGGNGLIRNSRRGNPRARAYGFLRTCWQQLFILIPQNIRNSLAKQNQAGSYMWVTVQSVTLKLQINNTRKYVNIQLWITLV